jgi:hypothetical protein
MKLSEIKSILKGADSVNFLLENGQPVPAHFHVTEIGVVNKHFIDCGGKVRNESKANFQLWDANDFEHRLKAQKLLNIISLCEQKLNIGDFEIEVEYQSGTIGKYGLDFNGRDFILTNKRTACLAQDQCGIPAEQTTNNKCCSGTSTCN